MTVDTTNYVGEMYRVTTAGTDWDASELEPAKVTAVKVQIFNSVGVPMIDESEMAWSAQEKLWEYMWLSTTDNLTTVDDGGTAVPAGSYRAKCKVIDLDGHPSWGYVKIRLNKNPVGA
jgi:hypothetical protein